MPIPSPHSSRPRRALLGVVALSTALSIVPVGAGIASAAEPVQVLSAPSVRNDVIRVSDNADRSGHRALNGTTIDDEVFVFIDDPTITAAHFTLDGTPVRGETNPPYDFEVSTNKAATALRELAPGQHTITATVTLTNGTKATATATFTKQASAPKPDPQPDPGPGLEPGTKPEPSPQPERPVTVDWAGDFERGFATTGKDWIQQKSSNNRIQLVNGGTAIRGKGSVKVHAHTQDRGVAGAKGDSIRTELRAPSGVTASGQGREAWWGWSVKLDPTFPTPPKGGWAILTQFHGGAGSPVVAYEVTSGNDLIVRVRGGKVGGGSRSGVLVKDVKRGHAYDIKMFVRWSTKSDGVVKVWIDGQLRQTITGPNLYQGHENDVYLKAGVYRTPAPRESIVYFDSFVRGKKESDVTFR